MADTPRTDRNYIRGFEALSSHTLDEDEWVRADFTRQLERELAEARKAKTRWDAVISGDLYIEVDDGTIYASHASTICAYFKSVEEAEKAIDGALADAAISSKSSPQEPS